jgi:arylsulfatase A-like enzyme
MNIVVFHIDALQPAYIGAYGCDWVATPSLDSLAARGVVFDQHFAAVPEAPPKAHPLQRVGLEITTLTSLLPQWKLTAKDLAKYFDDEPDDESESAEPWLDTLPDHIDDNDDATFEQLQRTYAAAVTKADVKLAKLLSKHGDGVVIVTSGRGIALGEHGYVGFPTSLHEELVHLPLIIAWPDGRHAGRRVSALTQPMDLAPTIAELLGAPWTPEGEPVTHGRNLLPLIESPLATLRSSVLIRNGEAIGIRTPNWYYLSDSRFDECRLFVKPDDRWEVNDVHRHHPAICEELESLLAKHATTSQVAK